MMYWRAWNFMSSKFVMTIDEAGIGVDADGGGTGWLTPPIVVEVAEDNALELGSDAPISS
jgi:hypothetical protein